MLQQFLIFKYFYLLIQNHNIDQKREIKSFADCIISNAENNGFVPVKRSFVEEVSDMVKWKFDMN